MKKMGKGEAKTAKPLLMLKPEAELSEMEKKQLAALKVGTGDDFNAVITECAGFFNHPDWKVKRTDGVRSERDKKVSYDIVWEQMTSPGGTKVAAKFTATVADLPVATLVRVLGADCADFMNAKTMPIYYYDTLMEENLVECKLANNLMLNRSCHKAPVFTVANREMRGYLAYVNLFDSAQQAKLKLVPHSFLSPANGAESAATIRDKDAALVVMQGLIDFDGFNKSHGLTELPAACPEQRLETRKKHVLGACHHYVILGQEEANGALTITLIVDVDPRGSMPTMLVDKAMSAQLETVKRLIQLCERESAAVTTTARVYENTRDFATFPKSL